jgi:hypothetical protein
MAHFFHSASQVLLPTGKVIISLVQGQETRWDVVDQSKRIGFSLASVDPFVEDHFPGYICKRNKTGQSFKNQATRSHMRSEMPSFIYRFQLGTVAVELPGITVEDPTEELTETFQQQLSLQDQTKAPRRVVTYSPALLKEHRSLKRSKNSKKQHANNPNALKSNDTLYACPMCSKQLPSLRAASQHYHMIHVLKQAEESSIILQCTQCESRAFRRQADLDQHCISQHSVLSNEEVDQLQQITNKAAPSVSLPETSTSDSKYFPCDVCGQAVLLTPGSNTGLLLHLETLKPVVGLKMQCPLKSMAKAPCEQKTFTEGRALDQHFRFHRAQLHALGR